jgi:hypothetical protein
VPVPTENNAGSKARVGSNIFINGQNNNTLQGDAVLATNATVSGITVNGNNLQEGAALPTPTMPAWSPPGCTTDLVVSNDTVLPGGSYWYDSMTINANLTYSGPATVYVNGTVAVGGTLAPVSGKPGDLTIYQYGSNSFGDSASNGMDITANVIAPNSDFTTKNNLEYYGSGIFNSITTKNNADFFYDTALGPADGSLIVSTVR